MNSSEVKTLLLNVLSIEADTKLAFAGFQRKAKSTEFIRKLPDAVQTFDFSFAIRPSYQSGALAHVYPRLELSMPSVCHEAEELVAGNSILLANEPTIMVNRPLEHFVPKSERVQWYAMQGSDFLKIANEVTSVFMTWGLKFFDDYRDAHDVVRGFELNDDRPKKHESWTIFVAASMLQMGDGQRALDLMNTVFRTAGSRKKYSTVFEAIEKKIRDKSSGHPYKLIGESTGHP